MVWRDFKAELLCLGVAAEARNAEHSANDLDLEHPEGARRPGRVEPGTFRPVAGDGGRGSGEFQRAVRVDRRPPVGHFHVRDGVFHQAIEARHRAAGVGEIIAAASRDRWDALVVRAVAGHGSYHRSRGQFSVAILILFWTA